MCGMVIRPKGSLQFNAFVKENPVEKVPEVSGRSEDETGIKLSALHLIIKTGKRLKSVLPGSNIHSIMFKLGLYHKIQPPQRQIWRLSAWINDPSAYLTPALAD